jgi:type III pantothenate kinase
MLLAIDAGNTNVVFAVCDGGKIRAQWRAATKVSRTADEYAVWLAELCTLQGLSLANLTEAIIATVVPAALFDLKKLCADYLHCRPMVVGEPDVDLGIGIKADRPGVVGADRLINAIAAHERYPGALIVVDFGTATTFDVVAPNGDYEGGVIAPGVNLSAEALHQAAAMLPRVAVVETQAIIGKDTIPAMQSGIYWGYVGLVEGLVQRIKAEYAQPMTVIATGGLAGLFHARIAAIEHVDPDLTIRGLMLVHERNGNGRAALPKHKPAQ